MPRDLTTFPEIETPVDVGAERLRILADFLETQVPDEMFDLRDWVQDRDFVDCGSAACACGWATTIPAFRAAGLRLVGDDEGVGPVFKGAEGWDAVCAFFGLSFDQAVKLFDGGSYPYIDVVSPADVAARIREHLARRSEIGGA